MDKQEPLRSSLMALRSYILNVDAGISEDWKYKMPCYCDQGKVMCYLWQDKKTRQPYILVVEGKKIEHPVPITIGMVQDKRARMKILMFDANKDLPVKSFYTLLKKILALYK